MAVYALGDLVPVLGPDAYVHPDAVVIGAVELGEEASVWPGAVLRADYGRIVVGARTSVQDGTVVHTTQEWATLIGADCVVGHNAHLEGCVVEDRCVVGSGSVVLNRARIGTGSVVGANGLVPEGRQVEAGHLAVGVPVRTRPLDPQEHEKWIDFAVRAYRENAQHYRHALRRID
jgi:carbonic anhydrase/acetyltransferase-like protein (isoleucine patch superfamily)